MNLLVTGAWPEAKKHIRELEERGHRVHFMQYEMDELPCSPDQVEGVICNGLFLYHKISIFPMLKYIQLTSAGYDRVPIEYIKEHDIAIFNASGVYSIPMAEFAIAGVLDMYKRMGRFRINQREHRWEKQRDLLELYGRTVSIFGCGSVGCACAERFVSFGTRVIGVKRTHCDEVQLQKLKKSGFSDIYLAEQSLAVIRQSDIIISTLPYTDETRNFFDSSRISAMKQEAIFINISRGGVVESAALQEAIKKGMIAGAILDVFVEEPLPKESDWWDMNNVLLFPHNSFVGEHNQKRLWEIIKHNMEFV